MAQFNIDASLSNGKRIDWLAIQDEGESVADAVHKVRLAACFKFGRAAERNRWTHQVASNGCITVSMHV